MIAAFAYLIGRSTRNRFLAQARRVRNPRYAFAALVGIAYFVLVFWNRSTGRSSGPSNTLLGPMLEALSPVIILLVLGGAWLFRGDQSALAFTEAEVALLFTAPVTRRGLIVYKLVRSQVTILLSVLIWTLVLRRGNPVLPAGLSAIAFWALFSTMSLHRLGAALVRASTVEHGAAGARRNWMPITLAIIIFVVMMLQFTSGHSELSGGSGPLDFINKLTAFLSSAPVRRALYPVRLILAPTFAQSADAWGRAMLPALALLVVHVVWVIRSDTAFEEAAATASSQRARLIESMRQRRGRIAVTPSNGRRRTIRLAPSGHPGVAILWKNTIALMRASSMAVIIGPLVFGFALAIMLPKGQSDVAQAVAFMCVVMALFMVLIGGRGLRTDLRSDMLHLPLLKSVPLSGADLVAAEVASTALPLVAFEVVLIAIAYGAIAMSGRPFLAPDVRLALFAASPVVLAALNGASLTILNGTAVLFPAWVRLGPTGAGGIEAMGQQILTTFGTWFALALFLLVPGFAVLGIVMVGGDRSPLVLVVACVTGSLILATETWGAIRWLGRAFERAEPSQVVL